ncbi:SDR family oxidoreductase [Sphingobium sp. TB-6]|uniref:SDR family NAD(P)-dependent oxidoreductase n=1 Tax=Sphingobium sp. TB-6 TaxID=2728850 RepID=UPI000B3CC6D2|nr:MULTISPECIES: SDR family oxidoreductase [Sphingomonadaceae]NML87631.1 SDR family oxidoreductase [Sphingobium sp. TB-6]
MARVADKVAIVTGAGTGVGRACMMLLAAEGARVVGVGRTRSSLDETLALVTEAGGEGRVVVADLSLDHGAQEVVDATLEAYGRIDILVHAAGVGYSWQEKSPGSMNDVVNTTPDKWREVIGINLDACYLMNRAVLAHMIDNGGGAIVNVASISGSQGLAAAHAYTAAKAGMINLTRSLCVAYAKHNIRANCVAPGFIDTPMVASVMNVFEDEAAAEQIAPMRRAARPEEIAYGCLYLASDEASYCNGSVLVIDGGTSARQ